jgi:hypothetical protein
LRAIVQIYGVTLNCRSSCACTDDVAARVKRQTNDTMSFANDDLLKTRDETVTPPAFYVKLMCRP